MQASVAKQNGGGRYRSLVVFVLTFVVAIVLVLGLNFYVADQFEADGEEINLAGRQRMLSQRIVKSLQGILAAQQDGADVTGPLAELRTSFELFDRTLAGFSVGGETLSAGGELTTLAAVSSPATRPPVDTALAVWRDYRAAVQALLDYDAAQLQAVGDVTRLLADGNAALLRTMNDLTTVLAEQGADPVVVNLAGRQRMLSQQITKATFGLARVPLTEQPVAEQLAELRDAATNFDSTLRAFDAGGSVVYTDGTIREVAALEAPAARAVVATSLATWAPIQAALERVLTSRGAAVETLQGALQAALANNLELLRLMNDLTVGLESDSAARANILRAVQVVGILIALAMFGIMIFYFVRQLAASDAEALAARAETEQILGTVNNGLFLMDSEHRIAGQHSESLPEILNVEQPAGQSFLGILKRIVPEKTLETAQEYLDLLFGDRVHEDLVLDLNPLNEVEVYFDREEGVRENRHLEFSFRRVQTEENAGQLLVQVDDVTEQVRLRKDLAAAQEKSKAQFELLLKVLHVEPSLLTRFLSETEEALKQINWALETREESEADLAKKIDVIYRLIHGVKGDAASLELDVFENGAHEFEGLLEDLKARPTLDGKAFLPLTIALDEFLNQIAALKALILRLGDLQRSVSAASDIPEDASMTGQQLATTLSMLGKRVAQSSGKEVTIMVTGEEHIPVDYSRPVREILTQLTRNAVAHGIEEPAEREAGGKARSGSVSIRLGRTESGGLQIVFRDDGRGLCADSIRGAAVEKGIVSAEQAESMSDKQAIGLIFRPGFSTRAGTDKHAGRGVGMDMVAAQLREHNGRVGIRTVVGEFSEFNLFLPELEARSVVVEEG